MMMVVLGRIMVMMVRMIARRSARRIMMMVVMVAVMMLPGAIARGIGTVEIARIIPPPKRPQTIRSLPVNPPAQ